MNDMVQVERRWQASAETTSVGQTFTSGAKMFLDSSRLAPAPQRVEISPQQYCLKRLGLEHYRLVQPILLDVTLEDDVVIVSDSTWNQFGAGENLDAAVAEYGSMLVEYYEELEASEAVLAPHMRLHLRYLREVLAPF